MAGDPAGQQRVLLQRLIGSRQWDRALDVAREILSQDPENAEAHLAAGQALVNLHKFHASEVHLNKALALRPNSAFAHRLVSIAALNQDEFDKANQSITRAIELQPNDSVNWYQLALMRYRQGALEAAEKHARRSLELNPNNADTLNLIAICQRGNPSGQLEQYLKALEIDPESKVVHINLGSYYLNTARDYARAEACFRQALRIDPSNAMAQKLLFTVLRLRDPIYRVLTFPREMLRHISWSRRDRTAWVRVALLGLWLCMGRYFILVFALWLLLVWPLVKAYEYLTLSDIRSKAGEIGARRGGWLGTHRWPLMVRLSLFGLLIILFWGGIGALYLDHIIPREALVVILGLAVLLIISYRVGALIKKGAKKASAARAERRFKKSQPQKDPY